MLTRNRAANLENPYQGKASRVLCVCSAGMLRSPTAAWVLSNDPWNFNTRSCGTEDYALVPLDAALVGWATGGVVVMDYRQEKAVKEVLKEYGWERPVYDLNVPDHFDYRDPELVALLTEELLKVFPV